MKILNIENNRTILYVQIKDLIVLNQTNEIVPSSIYGKIIGKNRNDFIKLDTQREIDFIEKMPWILNYRYFVNANYKDLINIESDMLKERQIIIDRLNRSNSQNNMLTLQQRILKHKIETINDIIKYKNGSLSIPFPMIPDNTKNNFIVTKSKYELQSSINPLSIIISTKDNSRIKYMPKNILNLYIEMALLLKNTNNEFFIPLTASKKYVTKNRKHLIIELKPDIKESTIDIEKQFYIKKNKATSK